MIDIDFILMKLKIKLAVGRYNEVTVYSYYIMDML